MKDFNHQLFPTGDRVDLQVLSHFTKEATGLVGHQESWIDRYEGTPLFDQAFALQQQILQMELLQMETERIKEDEEDKLRRESKTDYWGQRRQLDLQKDLLDLQLAKVKNDEAMASAPPPTMPPPMSVPGLAPLPEKTASHPFVKEAVPGAGVLSRFGDLGRAALEHGIDTNKLKAGLASIAPHIATGAITGGITGAVNADGSKGESTIGGALKGALGGAAIGTLGGAAGKVWDKSSRALASGVQNNRLDALSAATLGSGKKLLTPEGRAMMHQGSPTLPPAGTAGVRGARRAGSSSGSAMTPSPDVTGRNIFPLTERAPRTEIPPTIGAAPLSANLAPAPSVNLGPDMYRTMAGAPSPDVLAKAAPPPIVPKGGPLYQPPPVTGSNAGRANRPAARPAQAAPLPETARAPIPDTTRATAPGTTRTPPPTQSDPSLLGPTASQASPAGQAAPKTLASASPQSVPKTLGAAPAYTERAPRTEIPPTIPATVAPATAAPSTTPATVPPSTIPRTIAAAQDPVVLPIPSLVPPTAGGSNSAAAFASTMPSAGNAAPAPRTTPATVPAAPLSGPATSPPPSSMGIEVTPGSWVSKPNASPAAFAATMNSPGNAPPSSSGIHVEHGPPISAAKASPAAAPVPPPIPSPAAGPRSEAPGWGGRKADVMEAQLMNTNYPVGVQTPQSQAAASMSAPSSAPVSAAPQTMQVESKDLLRAVPPPLPQPVASGPNTATNPPSPLSDKPIPLAMKNDPRASTNAGPAVTPPQGSVPRSSNPTLIGSERDARLFEQLKAMPELYSAVMQHPLVQLGMDPLVVSNMLGHNVGAVRGNAGLIGKKVQAVRNSGQQIYMPPPEL